MRPGISQKLLSLKNLETKVFVKRKSILKHNKRYSCSTVKDYKVLLRLALLFVFPYAPHQLRENSLRGKTRFLKSLTGCFHVGRTIIGCLCIYYAHVAVPTYSLGVTFNFYTIFAMALSWCFFFKQHHVVDTFKKVIAVSKRACPGFRSRWNMRMILLFNTVGFFSSIVINTSFYSYVNDHINTTCSPFFLWYEIDKKHAGLFRISVILSVILTSVYNAVVCILVILMGSTVYFHVGDIISIFGTKLKKNVQSVDQGQLREILSSFEEIRDLIETVEKGFSYVVLLDYGALLSNFFMGVSLLVSFREVDRRLYFLLLLMFATAFYSFLSITFTGDRIKKKRDELKKTAAVATSSVVNASSLNEKEILRFFLVLNEMKTADLQVTGGGMFVISNSVILSVAGTLVTYGVIVSQMD